MMAFNIVNSEITLNCRFNNYYYEQGNDLRKMGDPQMGFSDADILEITNHGYHDDHPEVKFFKERIYGQPNHILFTIYNTETNLIMTELHVYLDEKRSFWRRNREARGRVFPNISLKLRIIQDPNHTTYKWTGEYWG